MTAKALGLIVPPPVLVGADEVIDWQPTTRSRGNQAGALSFVAMHSR
jgi:hypothetical protein